MKLLPLLVMLAGCAVADGTHFVTPVGETFEGTWAEEVAEAAQEWSDVGCLIEVSEDGVPVMLTPPDEWNWGDDYLGWTHMGDDAEIDIRSSLGPEKRHKVLLHEFGHFLGFEHRDWGIMRPHISQDYVTEEDCNG